MKKLLVVLIMGLLFISVVGYAKPFNKGPLTKITFIHYKKGFGGKPGTECGNGVCEAGENAKKCPADCGGTSEENTTCYDLMAKGFKWKDLPQGYVVHPDVEAADPGAIEASILTWDSAIEMDFFIDAPVFNASANYDDEVIDGRNEFSLGDYPEDGVIAVTAVWGYFYGPPRSREIVEFDVLFDTNFEWGDAELNPTLMDLQNIATHEIGHGLGLSDLYETKCSEETMYGYSWEGDIKKRELNDGDIAGLNKLYS